MNIFPEPELPAENLFDEDQNGEITTENEEKSDINNNGDFPLVVVDGNQLNKTVIFAFYSQFQRECLFYFVDFMYSK